MPQTDRALFLEWARKAEAAGFSTLGTIDKPNYDSLDPLISLAVAAGATDRIRLATTILQLPNRNETLVAKQVAGIDLLSNGRMIFGTAVGGRDDDFEVFGASMKGRGARFEQQLQRIHDVWSEARTANVDAGVLGPAPVQQPGPPIWLGGMNEKTIQRAIRLGDGFIFGTTGPQMMSQFAPQIREWAKQAGKPNYTVAGLAYAGFGPDPKVALDRAAHQVLRYYGQLWTEPENLIHHGPPEKIAEELRLYRDGGLDEVIVLLEIPEVEQLDLLARAVELAQVG